MSGRGIVSRRFVTGTIANFFLYVNYYVLMVSVASYCNVTYEVDLTTAGFAASVFILGALVARLLSPLVISLIGRMKTLIFGLVLITALSVAYLAGGGLVGLFVIRALHGFGYGVAQTAVTSLVTEGIPSEHRGEGIGYYMLSTTVGSAVGPFAGTATMHAFGFDALFALCVAFGAAGLASALAMAPGRRGAQDASRSARSQATSGESAGRDALAQGADEKGAGSQTADQMADAEGDKASAPRPSTRRISLASFIEKSAIPISTVAILIYLCYGAIVTYLNSFAVEVGLTGAASVFFVAYAAAMLVARPVTGRLFDERGDLLVMVGGCLVFAGGVALLAAAQSSVVLLAAACLLGAGIGAVQPSGLAVAIGRAPASRLDVANSTYFVCLDAAVGISPLVLGWTVPLIGYRGLFCVLVGISLAALALYLVFRARRMV